MLNLAIGQCWNVGLLSTEAMNVVVVVSVEFDAGSRPIESTIRQVEANGGSLMAQRVVFEAGRQAILQCGINGYGLPQSFLDQGRPVEIEFDPTRMSFR